MLKHCQIWTVTSTDPRHERFSLELLGGLTDYSPQTHKKFLPQTSSEHPKNEIVTIIRKKNIFNIILVKNSFISKKTSDHRMLSNESCTFISTSVPKTNEEDEAYSIYNKRSLCTNLFIIQLHNKPKLWLLNHLVLHILYTKWFLLWVFP